MNDPSPGSPREPNPPSHPHDDVQRQLDAYSTPLAAQLLEQSARMASYAASEGLEIPQWLGNALAKIGAKAHRQRRQLEEAETRGDGERARELRQAVGVAVREDLRGLVRIHGILSHLVAPATPRSIAVTQHVNSFWGALRKIPLLGWMVSLAALFFVGFILSASAMLGAPDSDSQAFLYYLHLLSAAGLGACFYALFTAHGYVTRGTYDPKYTLAYWIRLFLGLLAGSIAGILLFAQIQGSGSGGGGGAGLLGDGAQPQIVFSASLVALLGGYSADAINRILKRLVEALITLVRGDVEARLEVRERELKLQAAEDLGKRQLQVAAQLLELRHLLGEEDLGESVAALQGRLDSLLEEILGDAAPEGR